jgi:putative iron-dependent peroxidase
MFVGRPAGNTDRILDFSIAVSGSLFFVPSADFLDNLPPRPGIDATIDAGSGTPAPAAPDDPRPDHSLRIGSLRRSTPS